MKVLKLHGIQDMRMHDEPVPTAKEGETLLQVKAVGICGSDLHWFEEAGIGDAQLADPLVLGHEFAAVIAEGPNKGQAVAVDPSVPCGHCEFCLNGNPNVCPNHHFAGHGSDEGALREFMAWPDKCLFPIPPEIDFSDGAMLEPLGVAIHATDLAHLRPGMTVGVFGCGPIGLMIVQMARAAGATKIIATDKLQHRLDAAAEYGAVPIQAYDDHRESAEVRAATPDGLGVDVAFEIAGDNAAVESAIESARPLGAVILVGIPSDDHTSFRASTARRKGVTIRLARRMKHMYPRAINLVQSGLVDVRSLVSHHFPLDEYQKAFSVAQQRIGHKVMIEL